MRLPAECAGNGKAEGLTSSPGGYGRYRIRGHADASGNHFCAGRETYLCGTLGICARPPWAWPPGGRSAPHGAGLARVQGSPVRRIHDQGPRELASVPAGPRSQPVRPVRPACGLPRPARGQPAVPRAPGRPHRDDQHPGGRFHPGAGLRHGQPGRHRGRDRDPAAGRRVSDPRRPGSGDRHLARGSGRIGHRTYTGGGRGVLSILRSLRRGTGSSRGPEPGRPGPA